MLAKLTPLSQGLFVCLRKQSTHRRHRRCACVGVERATLTLIGRGRSRPVGYPKTLHVGFIQPTEADVDKVNARSGDDGFDVEPPSRQHGAWTFYLDARGASADEYVRQIVNARQSRPGRQT